MKRIQLRRISIIALVLLLTASSLSPSGLKGLVVAKAHFSPLSDPIQVLNSDNNYFLKIDLDDPRVHPKVMLANNDGGGLQTLPNIKGRLEGSAQWAVVNGDLFSGNCPGGVNCAQGLTYIGGQRKDNWSAYGSTWQARGNIGFNSSNDVEISQGDGQSKRYMTIAGGPRIVMGGGTPTCQGQLITVGGATKTLFPASGEQFDGDVRSWCSDTRAITMLGYSADGRYLYMGISKGGKTATQLAQWLKDRGAHEVLRLDSGGSSGMYHNGAFVGGSGSRAIADAFAITVDNAPPPSPCPAPTLRSPNSGFTSADRTIAFDWDDVSCSHNGFTFRVKTVPTMDSGGETVVDTGEGSTERTVTLESRWDNRDLYWSVRAANAPSGVNWAPARQFRISPNAPPSISFNTANGSSASSISSRDQTWTFTGTASDPENRLNRIEFRCNGDGCGSGNNSTTNGNWSFTRTGISGKNDIYFVVFDDKHSVPSRHLDLNIDLAKPVTNEVDINGKSPGNLPAWFTQAVTVRLRAQDNGTGRATAGVDKIYYRIDSGGWQSQNGATASFPVSADGEHTVQYYAVDKVGNQEDPRSVSFGIDKTPPTPIGGVNETNSVPSNVWQKAQNTPNFTWNASSDPAPGSGLWGYQFYFGPDPNGEAFNSFEAGAPRQWKPQPGGVRTGTHYLRGRTRDIAGNYSAWATLFVFKYDGTPPENPKEATHAAGVKNDVWQRTTSAADFTWPVPHDEGSGIKGYLLYWGTDPNGASANQISASGYQNPAALCGPASTCSGYLRLRSLDHVDHQAEDWSTAFILRYDNTPPTLDFTFNQGITQTTQTLLTLNLAAADTGSGVKAMRFSSDGQDWTSWEAFAPERLWTIPGISRQSWPVYVQVKDGVGLVSAVVTHAIYLDVNAQQPRSEGYRLFDHAMVAGGGSHTSQPSGYQGHSSVGQVMDSPTSSSRSYTLHGGYQAGSQALPLTVPGHDEYTFINGIFASGASGATTLTSPAYQMYGTLGEPGLPNNITTLASAGYQHQPGFLAADPAFSPAPPTPTPTPGPTPTPEPIPACDFPAISINQAALFTNDTGVTLSICAPNAAEMRLSNDGGFLDAVWEPYAETRSWTITSYGQYVLPYFVYMQIKDKSGVIHGTYFDNIIYDPNPPTAEIAVGDSVPAAANLLALAAQSADAPAVFEVDGVRYIQRLGDAVLSQPLALLSTHEGAVDVFVVNASDDSSGLAEMQLSASDAFTGTEWAAYSALTPWTPSGGDGVKTLYARFRDGAGNISTAAQTQFALDTLPPIGGIALSPAVVGPDITTVTIYLGAEDNLSGVAEMRISEFEDFHDAPWRLYENTVEWPLTPTGPEGALYVQYRDWAGNVSETFNHTYLNDTEPPVLYVEVEPAQATPHTVRIWAYDELSALDTLSLTNDPWFIEGVVTQPYTDTVQWSVDERNVVWVWVKDSAGNASEPYPAYAGPAYSNVAADCNNDWRTDAGDISALVLEIFDGDGNDPPAAPGGAFAGNPYGCDANADVLIDAGDISCTVLTIFNGPGACAAAALSAPQNSESAGPRLSLPEMATLSDEGWVEIPVHFQPEDNAISSLAFSLAYDPALLSFDPTDGDGDGLPDTVQFQLPPGFSASVVTDEPGRIGVLVAAARSPQPLLSEGVIAMLRLRMIAEPLPAEAPLLQFAAEPAASFGSADGRSLPGRAEGVSILRADGFFQLFMPVQQR